MEKTDLYLEKYTVVSKQSWWQGFKRAVYNPREKTVFYRNKQSWGKFSYLFNLFCIVYCSALYFVYGTVLYSMQRLSSIIVL